MAKFAILMSESDAAWARLPRAEQDRPMALYVAWAEDLRERGVLAGGEALGMPGTVLRPVKGGVVEERYWGADDALTGWFVVEAKDLAEAVAIARGCPALLHGESITVRPAGQA
jgi:hypothetical protein